LKPRPGAAATPSPDDNAVLLLSGGTTGTPKAVVGTHRDLVAAGLQIRAWLAVAGGPAKAEGGHDEPGSARGDIALLPLPLFHVYACAGVQSHALISRTPLALVPNPRDLDDLLKTIERVKPTLVSAVIDRDGLEGAREIANQNWMIQAAVSSTFHGRDEAA
jgi:long-chain acyl-CoA synthetase